MVDGFEVWIVKEYLDVGRVVPLALDASPGAEAEPCASTHWAVQPSAKWLKHDIQTQILP